MNENMCGEPLESDVEGTNSKIDNTIVRLMLNPRSSHDSSLSLARLSMHAAVIGRNVCVEYNVRATIYVSF